MAIKSIFKQLGYHWVKRLDEESSCIGYLVLVMTTPFNIITLLEQ